MIKLKLFTGRTHQIRVHMSFSGNPLLGDELYGGNKKVIDRQALHCYNLKFKHPITRKNIDIVTQLPEDMNNIVRNLVES